MAVPSFERADRRSAPLFLRLLPDERLARRAENSDLRAVAEIDRRYRRDLYRFCLAMVGNPQDAEAALEGAIIKVHRGLETGERRIRLKPWLYRIARSETMDALCGPRLAGALEPDQHRLLADLERLPQRQRAVFVMRELSGLGFVEIGAAFGISADTAEHDHHTARKRLGRLDRRRGGVDIAALPPLPLAAGGGSGLAGTIAAGLGNSIGASVVVKATATVAVVAAAGLSVQERGGKDASPPNRSDDGGALSWSAPDEHAPRPVEHESVSGVAAQRNVMPSTPSTPTAYVHQSEPPRTAGSPGSEKGEGPDLSDESLTVATAPARPLGEHGQPSPQPHSEVDVPFEEAVYEDPEEAVSSEASEAESQPTPAEPAEPQEESSGEQEPPAAPAPPPSTPEPPATSPAPPSAERSWGRHGGSRGRGSRRRW